VIAVRNASSFFYYSTRPIARVLTPVVAIPEIEEKARSWKSRARAESLYNDHKSPFWTEEENIELFTRRMIQGNFVNLLGKQLSAADLQALETVLFTISYPILNLHYPSEKFGLKWIVSPLLITTSLFLILLFVLSIIFCGHRLLKDLLS
jgi:hypothetical protein